LDAPKTPQKLSSNQVSELHEGGDQDVKVDEVESESLRLSNLANAGKK